MADHAPEVELFYDGTWHPQPAYVRDGMTLSRGAAGEGQESPPSKAVLSFDDRAGDLSPTNVFSPLYGKISRNTPMRVTADGAVRSTTEMGALTLDQTLDFDGVRGDAWAAVEGGGILRRLQQGKTPLRAPLERAILAAGPAAYWPMTEGKDGTQFTSGIGGPAIPLLGSLELGSVDGPAGVGVPLPNFVGGGGGEVASPGLTAAEWGFEAVIFMDPTDLGTDASHQLAEWTAAGDIGRDGWGLGVGYDPGGDGLFIILLGDGGGASVGFGVGGFNLEPGWHHVRVQAEQVSGNVDITMWVDGAVPANGTDTAAGTLGGPGPVTVGVGTSTGATGFRVAALGALAFYSGTVPDHSAAAVGYVGERAAARFVRVLGEEGVAAVIIGDPDDTQPMGAQPRDTLVNVAKECVRTDDGMLFEPADDRALVMRTGRSRYNQTAAHVFDFAAGQFAPGFKPIFDDQATRNDVTAARRNGGEARAVQETGPLNVQDPVDDPQGIGRADQRVDVNTADDEVLLSHATWHLAKGTTLDPRYSAIVIDLDAAPSLIPFVDALEIGQRVEVENLPARWQVGPASLLLVGVKDMFPAGGGDFRRLVALVGIPASPYEVLLVGAADGSVDLRGQRVGTELSTVDGDHTSSDTTILIDSGGVEWTTAAADFNPSLNGGGMFLTMGAEVVRATGISGAGSAWTITVIRAVNGVSDTIPDGTPVRFTYPGRLGL